MFEEETVSIPVLAEEADAPALKVILEENGNISGQKKLGVFGASYLYPMFLRFGLIDTERKSNGYLPDMDNV